MSLRQKRIRRKKPVPIFENRFEAALSNFSARLLETAPVSHAPSKGAARERTLADFFGKHLPGKYHVTSGIVVDAEDRQSPQLDVLLFDQSGDFPVSAVEDNGVGVLAAEALLASVEVKSKLTAQELQKSCAAARNLRSLRPYGNDLIGGDVGGGKLTGKRARYHHSIFAFDTDLVDSGWPKNEFRRLRRAVPETEHLIDAIYVFRRGLINPTANKAIREDDSGSAIAAYYFSLLNFVQRESGRRSPTPYSDYASLLRGPKWEKIE